ncbi:hypothetical protein TNCV_593021 [Trichonephila clavipes]|nr:hypothetical protein TNCV_593021 [Trichonephila clavipes]
MWVYPAGSIRRTWNRPEYYLHSLWKLFYDDGNVSRRYSTCHPRVTTPIEDWGVFDNNSKKEADRVQQPSCFVSYLLPQM